MEKARLGVSVGLLGAAVYFMGLVNAIAMVLLVGCVLLIERNAWLRRNAVKALTLVVIFSAARALFNLIPEAINVLDCVASMVGLSVRLTFITSFIHAIMGLFSIWEKLLLLVLGFAALSQTSITIPVLDDLINKYM